MLGSDPRPLQLVHWQSDALTTRPDLIRRIYRIYRRPLRQCSDKVCTCAEKERSGLLTVCREGMVWLQSIPDTVWAGVVPLFVNDMAATGLQVGQGFTRRYSLVAQPGCVKKIIFFCFWENVVDIKVRQKDTPAFNSFWSIFYFFIA